MVTTFSAENTLVLALFGLDLSYSQSPALQNAWLREANINAQYLPLAVKSESDFYVLSSALMNSKDFLGANITNPYKSSVVELLKENCDERVKCIGAANTLFRCNGAWQLTNTDVDGILASIKGFYQGKKDAPGKAIIAGAGGAAAAAAFALANFFPRVEILYICRNPQRAHRYLTTLNLEPILTDTLKDQSSHERFSGNESFLLINTFPLGQHGESNPICENLIQWVLAKHSERSFYFDMTYGNPVAVRCAAACGVPAVDGKIMLREQAFKSFSIWKDSLTHFE